MKIESYSFGEISIEGEKFTNDVIIFPDRVKDNWWRDEGHFLQVQDLEDAFEISPDILIVGQGAYGRMEISDEVEERLENEGIELKSAKTDEAVEIYNKNDSKNKVAALHLTC